MKRFFAPAKSSTTKVPPSILRLADEVGGFMSYWGFKKIHGKIWTLAFLSEGPVEAKYFIENLGVSKALVSLSIKDLLQYRVLLEVESSGERNQRYVCNPQIATIITDVLREREMRMLGEIKLAQELSSATSTDKLSKSRVSKDRIDDIGKMIEQAQNILNLMIGLGTIHLADLASSLSFSTLNKATGDL